jgi:hypothetical protein
VTEQRDFQVAIIGAGWAGSAWGCGSPRPASARS